MPPLLPVERDTLSLAKAAQQNRGVEIILHYVGDEMPGTQRYQVCPAIILEAADRLTATLEIVIRQPRALTEYPSGAEPAEVQQSLAQVEQHRFDSRFWLLDSRSSFQKYQKSKIKMQNCGAALRAVLESIAEGVSEILLFTF